MGWIIWPQWLAGLRRHELQRYEAVVLVGTFEVAVVTVAAAGVEEEGTEAEEDEKE